MICLTEKLNLNNQMQEIMKYTKSTFDWVNIISALVLSHKE